MRNVSFYRLTLGLVLGVLVSLAAAYYSQGRELAWLRRHHASAHRREMELTRENLILKQRLEVESTDGTGHKVCIPPLQRMSEKAEGYAEAPNSSATAAVSAASSSTRLSAR